MEECTNLLAKAAQKISMTACGAPVRDKRAALYSVGPAVGVFTMVLVLIRVIARSPGKWGSLWWDDALVAISTVGNLLSPQE